MKKQNPKTSGIISIVFAGVSFFIFGFLSIAGLIMGVSGLVLTLKQKKDEGYVENSALVLNIVGTALSAVMIVLYIMSLMSIASAAA